jgi:hypothetical protein
LTTLGASERPVPLNAVARPGVVASVAAAGMSILACQAADADTITVSNPNVNIGFADGALMQTTLNIGTLALHVFRSNGSPRSLLFGMTRGTSRLAFRVTAASFPVAAVYGKKFSQVGARTRHPSIQFATVSTMGDGAGARFSKEYFDFYFTDGSSQRHYGWIYGSVTGGYSDLTYNLISYGYDTTPNDQIGAGYTGTPEPSTGVMVAMAALILGAAGVRKRNKAQA